MGLDGIEPSTSRLSGVRSNRTELQAPGCLGSQTADFRFKRNESIRNSFSEIQNPIEPTRNIHQRAMLDLSKLNSDGTVVELISF